MATNPFAKQPIPGRQGANGRSGVGGGHLTPLPGPPPITVPDPFARDANGFYVGRNGTPTSLPQPLVDMLAPTSNQMPASFGQFVAAGLPLAAPVQPGTLPLRNPQPIGPDTVPPPAPPKKKKKKAQAALGV